jgi:hypothetical protein
VICNGMGSLVWGVSFVRGFEDSVLHWSTSDVRVDGAQLLVEVHDFQLDFLPLLKPPAYTPTLLTNSYLHSPL